MIHRQLIRMAEDEARRFNHEYVGTEHLLLGLLNEKGGTAAEVLTGLRIELQHVRLEVEKILLVGLDMSIMGRLPMSPRAEKSIEYAIEEAMALGDDQVVSEHLLLGLLREYEGVAAQVLLNLGVDFKTLRAEVLRLRQQRLISDGPWRDRLEGASSKKWWQFWR